MKEQNKSSREKNEAVKKTTKKYLILTLIGALLMASSILNLETKIGPVIFWLGAAICFSPAILCLKNK